MKKLLFFALLFVFILNCEASPRENLSLIFREGMKWHQKMEVERGYYQGQRFRGKQIFKFEMEGEILEIENNFPVKMRYTGICGTQELVARRRECRKVRNGIITGMIDKNYFLIKAKDKNMSDDVLLAFPAGPIFGFIPPKAKVKQGDSWEAGKIIPLGPKTIRKGRVKIIKSNSKFKLDKLTGQKSKITWVGQGIFLYRNRRLNAKWIFAVDYDLSKKQVEKKCATVEVDFGAVKLITKINIVFKWRK